jgi:hypothetical protein
VDKMTEPQIAAKVREHFAEKHTVNGRALTPQSTGRVTK